MLRLPAPPDLAHIDASIPRFAPVGAGVERPFWSVMIPTYNSGPFLRRTLQSALREAPGPDRMQIEVVDGCSTTDDPRALVEELGRGRVEFHRLAANQGPALTLNTCIERARGTWVYILHGDDLILPGFYAAYERVIQSHPAALSIVGQVITVDEHDRWTGIQGPIPPLAGATLHDFAQKQLWTQQLRAPGVVVQRSAYERVGGFCTYFRHLLDWELYFRLAQLGEVACVPLPLALFRIHGESESGRIIESGSHVSEPWLLLQTNLARMGWKGSEAQVRAWRADWAQVAERIASNLARQGSLLGRFNYERWAWMLQPTPMRGLALLRSWLRLELGHKQQPQT